jgi:nucleoside-diphosphate-sugar epimerase
VTPIRVLVTGATGYIGTHLLPVLRDEGFEVRALRRAASASSPGATTFDWVSVGDIGPDTEWAAALAGVDVVVHLAALAHQIGPAANARSEDFNRINTLGTARLAEAAVEAGVRRVVMVSSVAAMGPYSREPFTELTPCAPDTPYGTSKLAAERSIERILAGRATDWCVVRPPLVYGPGNPGNMKRLLQLIERGWPLPLGLVGARRSHLFVGNLVALLALCAVRPEASRRMFLADDGEPVETRELVRELARLSGTRARVVPVPKPALQALGQVGDLLERIAGRPVPFSSYSVDKLLGSLVIDSRAVRAALSWVPPYDRGDALRKTVAALS